METAALTRDINLQIAAIGLNPGKWSIMALAAFFGFREMPFTNRHLPLGILEIDREIRGFMGSQKGPEMKNPPTVSGDFISAVQR